MRLLLQAVCLIVLSLLGAEALFGVEVSPNAPEATTITIACSRLVAVSQQIIDSVNAISDRSYATVQLQQGATALLTSVPQNYTALIAIANAISSANSANSATNLTRFFADLQAPLVAFGNASMEQRFGEWLRLMNTQPDFSNLTLTLDSVGTFFRDVLEPAVKRFGAARISQATFYNGVPKEQMVAFAQQLSGLARNQETIVRPFISSVASAFRVVHERQTQFLTSADQAFESVDGALTSAYRRLIELDGSFRAAASEMMSKIRASSEQFTRRLAEFTDLYLGGAAAEYTQGAMYEAYEQNVTAQVRLVEVRLEQARNDVTDSLQASLGRALQAGSSAVTQTLQKILQQATNSTRVTCSGQVLSRFSGDYSSLLRNAFPPCVSSGEYDNSRPTNTAIIGVRDILQDVLQYFQQLNNAFGGVTNSSPPAARIQLDTFMTAFFSQTFGIMSTLLQQLVNMGTELDVGYDLLIGRTRYCLAVGEAVAQRMTVDLALAVDAC